MTWFKVDDGFGEHAKVDALGADTATALAVWLLCGNACGRGLTDGVVTPALLARACAAISPLMRRKGVSALVRVGLWCDHRDGWVFHDWLAHQPSREVTVARREAEKARKSAQRDSMSRRDTERADPKLGTRDVQRNPALPSRSRPDPDPVPSKSESLSARPRADHPIAAKAEARTDARRVFIRLYAAAYRAAFSDDWLWAPHEQAIDTIAGWCSHKADPAAEVAKVVAGAFAHEPWKRHRYPPKWIAEDPAACVARASERSHEPDDFSHASTSTESPF